MSPSRVPITPPTLAGYRHLDHLGLGGFSDVFLYEREFPRQKVAIKVLLSKAVADTNRERFTAEANAMASLTTHPYIVSIYEAAISPEGYPYLVMEYYPRPNFNLRARTERFSVPAVLRAGIQVASAVETAHRIGVLHRDIKPANILTSEYGRPGLTDFGIAAADHERDLEAEGMSIPWSPPEVLAGGAEADERADIYSLGATLYTLLAGRSPFEIAGDANRSIDLIDRIQRQPVPKLDRAELPPALIRLLDRSMSKNPADRPASAAEFARALQVIEVDQRFDMTPFEVSDDHDEPSPGQEIDIDAGATRIKGPAVIESQPAKPAVLADRAAAAPIDAVPGADVSDATISRAAMRRAVATGPTKPVSRDLISSTPYKAGVDVPKPTSPAPGLAGPRRPVMPSAGDYTGAGLRLDDGAVPAPVLAPPGASSPAAAPVDAAADAPGRKVLFAVTGVVLLVAAIVVAVLVVGGGSKGTHATADATVKPTVPAVEHVTLTSVSGNTWQVHWDRSAGIRPTDTILTTVDNVPQEQRTGNEVTLRFPADPNHTPRCASVQVKRGDALSKPARSAGCSSG